MGMCFGRPSVQGIRFLLAKIFWAFFDGSHFRFVQEFEIRQEGEVVLHLFQMAHVGKHHHHAGEAGGEAHGSHDELRPPEAGGLGTGRVPDPGNGTAFDCGCGGANVQVLLAMPKGKRLRSRLFRD